LDEGRDLLRMDGEPAAVPMLMPRFGKHGHLVHAALAGQLDDEMTAAPVGGEQCLLDLGRKHVDSAQDDHVVAAAGALLHPPAGPAVACPATAGAGRGCYRGPPETLPWSATGTPPPPARPPAAPCPCQGRSPRDRSDPPRCAGHPCSPPIPARHRARSLRTSRR